MCGYRIFKNNYVAITETIEPILVIEANSPIVNINTNPKANNIEGVNWIDPP